MGYKIEIDIDELKKASSAVDDYIRSIKNKMSDVNKEKEYLLNNWAGADAVAFDNEWKKLDDKESAYKILIKSLENYSKHLLYAHKKYGDAQKTASQMAHALPIY